MATLTRTVVLAAALSLYCVLPGSAAAAEFAVNDTSDIGDADTSSVDCDSDLVAQGLQCTARAAVEQANATPGKDVISLPAERFVLGSALSLTDVVEIAGSGARLTHLESDGTDRVIDIGANSSISDLSISKGRVTNAPGAGIRITYNGPVKLNRLWIHDNHVEATESGHLGGGVANVNSPETTIENSTLSSNSIVVTADGYAEAFGGGLGVASNKSVILVNSTVTGNLADGRTVEGGESGQRGLGGGVASLGSVSVGFSTLADNTAQGNGASFSLGGNLYGSAGVGGSIIANGHATMFDNCYATLTIDDTVVSDDSCGTSDGVLIGDPELGPLTDNGGPTDTMYPSPLGLAVNAVPACVQATDQRGAIRPQADCDAGAAEISSDLEMVAGPAPASAVAGRTIEFTFALRNNGFDASGRREVTVSSSPGFQVESVRPVGGPCSISAVPPCSSSLVLPAGAEEELVVRGRAGSAGPVVVTASVNPVIPQDPLPANNQASSTVEVRPAPVPVMPAPEGEAELAIERLRLRHRVFRVGPSRRRAPLGTVILFELSKPAQVTFTLHRRTTGRRARGRCRKASQHNGSKPRCNLYRRAGNFKRDLEGGAQRVPFSGRVRQGRSLHSLKPGAYRLGVLARDQAGNRSPLTTIRFRVVR